jgi:hypothetical protein
MNECEGIVKDRAKEPRLPQKEMEGWKMGRGL